LSTKNEAILNLENKPELIVLGIQEFTSIASGIKVLDAMVKKAPVEIIDVITVNPGKYIILITGDVASVETSMEIGRNIGGVFLIDSIFISNLHNQVIPALKGGVEYEEWDAIGILESFSVSSSIIAADLAAKEADIHLLEIRYGIGMGGKSSVKLIGRIGEVEAAMETGIKLLKTKKVLCNNEIIARPHTEIKPFLYRG